MFSKALNRIVERLDQAHSAQLLSSYALIGGFAVSVWGVARATQDIDLAVALGTSEPRALAIYLGATYEPGGIDDPLRGVFRLSLNCEGQEVPVQLIVLPSKLAALAFQNIERVNTLGCSVPVVNWKTLILLKLYAGGPIDLLDAHNIVAVRKPGVNDRSELIALADTLELAQDVRTLLDSVT
ncbi:MAG TPA: hypothetical protein VJ760_08660 [Nitrospiraceae bacterium]|nr:hypothetical protein [Nitrospiraceae bacterium]